MAEKSLKLGQRVEVTGKEVRGSVAYVGTTMFASGKWIGVILDEPRGKNNGTVQGKTYFQCPENYGMFVRQGQLTLLEEPGTPASDLMSPMSSASTATTPGQEDSRRSRLSGTSIRRRTQPTTVRRKTSPPSSSRTRMEKSSSRLSLVSSRSQSDFSKDESGKEASTPSASEPTSKRASFIEKSAEPAARPQTLTEDNSQTGFVETLKPQYIPGPAMVSPGSSLGGGAAVGTVEERLSQLQMQQEIDGLRAEVRDLNEKLETLKVKRAQDKERLKDYDKLRMQMEQMSEFKQRIMESQAALQRDLQRAKQEARDAIDARERHADEMADLAETVEMATLDKEMAEEKAETLQMELEQVRERLEEVTLDLEIMKAELSERGGGGVVGDGSAFELKQLQQQNARLRETLLKMRDMSAHEKHEASKLQKELDQLRSEVLELQRTKEKLSSRVDEQEQQIADLQEQVDAALGAEEMVQQLVHGKLEMEERLKELQEAVAELEELQDMNEQLQEGSRELEVELREELDLAKAATRQAQRELEAMHETLADRDMTIAKFRELVQRQAEAHQELRDQLQRESSRPVSALPAEGLDFSKMIAETRAHTKAVDLELRRLDVQQANEHVRYLTAYMPESFRARGGDHEAISLLLLVPRIIWKTEILLSQLRDKFPSVDKVDRQSVVRSHSVEQFAYRCCLSFHLYWLQTVLQQFWHALSVCTPDQLLRAGASWSDMQGQEKAIDGLLDLLKQDKLDEHVAMEPLEKCVNYFSAVCPVVLGVTPPTHHAQLVLVGTRALQAACEGMMTQAAAVRAILQAGQDPGEMGLLAQHVATQAEALAQQLKAARRRLPHERAPIQLGLSQELVSGFQQAFLQAGRIVRTLQEVFHAAVQQLGLGEDVEAGIPHEKLREFAHLACDRVYDEDKGPVECVKSSVSFLAREVTRLSQFLADNEYEISTMTSNEEKPTPPIVIRAQTVKKELEETKILRHKLEMKDSDIKELKLTLKAKQEELSEMTIRKDMAEKKLGSSHKDYELTIEKLKRKVDDAQALLKRKEKEFEETMDHLQSDIDSLESEKGELKEKLKSMTKKALFEGISKSPGSASLQQQPLSISSSTLHGASADSIKDSPLLIRRIHDLEAALELAREENWRLRTSQMSQKLAALKPLRVAGYKPAPRSEEEEKEQEEARQRQARLAELAKKANDVKAELWQAMEPRIPDISKHQPGRLEENKADWERHEAQDKIRRAAAQERARAFLLEAAQEIIRSKKGGNVEADFTTFPTPEMTKAFGKTEPQVIGRVNFPSQTGESAIIPVVLTHDTLRQVHQRLLAAF